MSASDWMGGSGDWSDAAHWSGGEPNSTDARADIAAPGTYTVTVSADDTIAADQVSLDAVGATLQVDGTLDLSGDLDLQAGILDLGAGGSLTGGTIELGGGAFQSASGALVGVKVVGALQLTGDFGWLNIRRGLTVASWDGGRGHINLDGDFGVLDFEGSQTFDNAIVTLGSYKGFYNGDLILNTGQLTLGAHLTILSNTARALATIGGDKVVNDGLIEEKAAWGLFTIDAANFVNNQLISLGGYKSTLLADGRSFDNAPGAKIAVGEGDVAIIGGKASQFSNEGEIDVAAGGELVLRGSYNVTDLGLIDNAGQLDLDGALNNQGGVLRFGVGALAGSVVLTGSIVGGVVVASGASDTQWAGTLDGVTYRGALDLGLGPTETLIVQNGLVVTGADGSGQGLILADGAASTLIFAGDQTVDNATIAVGNGTTGDELVLSVTPSPAHAATLTLGPDLTIVAATASAVRFEEQANLRDTGTIINDGLIDAEGDGGSLTIATDDFANAGRIAVSNTATLVVSGTTNFTNSGVVDVGAGATLLFNAGNGSSFSNTGTIKVATGGVLEVTGAYDVGALGGIDVHGTFVIDGDVDNSGATIQPGTGPLFGGATVLGVNGEIDGGVLALGGGRLVWDEGDLANVQVRGPMALSAADAEVFLLGGVTLTGADGVGPGRLAVTGPNARLEFIGSQTLDNATITVGGVGVTDTVELFTVNVARHTLTFGAGLTLNATAAGSTVLVDDSYPAPDMLVNNGLIRAAGANGVFTIAIPTFTNDGMIEISNGEVFGVEGQLNGVGDIQLSAGGVLAPAGGAGAGETVAFEDGSGLLKLSDPKAFHAILTGYEGGDVIDLADTIATGVQLDADDRLLVRDGANSVAVLQLSGDYADDRFALGDDGADGTTITVVSTQSVRSFAQVSAGFSPSSAAAMTAAAVQLSAVRSPLWTPTDGMGGGRWR